MALRRKKDLDDLSIEAQYELHQGDPARSSRICRTLVEKWTEIQGPDGERVLTWRGFLGRALTASRKYVEAEQVLGDLLLDRTRIDGPDAPSTLIVRGNLARAVAGAGRPQEAALLAERLIEDRTRILGPEHRSTFDARGHLAHIHLQLGDPRTALELFTSLLADRERVLGPDHPDTVTTEANVAIVTARVTGAPDAVDGLRTDVAECERELGADHPATLDASALLAEQLLRADDPDLAAEALDHVERAVDGRRALYGSTDPRTLSVEVTRARCLLTLRSRSEALASLTDVVERADAAGLTADGHALTARSELVWALAEWFASGQAADEVLGAIRAHHAVLGTAGARLEPDHPVREIVDEVAELLEAVDSGSWFDEDGESA